MVGFEDTFYPDFNTRAWYDLHLLTCYSTAYREEALVNVTGDLFGRGLDKKDKKISVRFLPE